MIRAEPEYQPYSTVRPEPVVRRADPSAIHAVRLAPAGEMAVQKSAAAGGSFIPQQVGFARSVPELSDGPGTVSALRWRALDSGAQVAAMSVTSPGALSLRAGLRVGAMPAGTRVRFYAPAVGDTSEATAEEIRENVGRNLAAGELSDAALLYWSPLVEGDTLVVEIEIPAGASPAHLDVAVPTVSHLVTSAATNFAVPKAAAACENDVMCYQGTWANESDATARILFQDGGTSYVCTGTLVVDLDTSTSIPYFLTANHCINSQASASSMQSFWFYRSTSCDSGAKGGSVTLNGGATLLYNSATTDTSLMRLSGTPPGGAMYAGWSVGTPASVGAAVVGIHHPKGDLQKISFGNVTSYASCVSSGDDSFSCSHATSSGGTFIEVNWSSGMTEPGSSGSALFSQNGHYILGQLYGGDGTSCSDKGSDFYGRFDVAYNASLSRYLGGTPSSGGGGGGSGSTGGTPPPPVFTPAQNYTALWWNPSESGWGLSINQHSSALFAAWYAYAIGGTPTWVVMPGGTWTSTTTIQGDVYATSGPPSTGPYNISQVSTTKVGTATIALSGTDRAVLSYTVNGVSGTKSIQKQSFGTGDSSPIASYGDLWWNASESGWGLSIAQQDHTLFSVIYTYGQYGGPIWYVMPGGAWNGATYSGTLFRTQAAPGSFYGSAFNAAAVKATAVGTMSIAFSGTSSATLTYTVDGQTFRKQIARQPF
ncbi:MAG TPA: trypsin-like peptidase domain-containing protein [Usitatibacter sp.]|nr:trypsin-like peptidase domain-containing protein [Usitatibacter sp.]